MTPIKGREILGFVPWISLTGITLSGNFVRIFWWEPWIYSVPYACSCRYSLRWCCTPHYDTGTPSSSEVTTTIILIIISVTKSLHTCSRPMVFFHNYMVTWWTVHRKQTSTAQQIIPKASVRLWDPSPCHHLLYRCSTLTRQIIPPRFGWRWLIYWVDDLLHNFHYVART